MPESEPQDPNAGAYYAPYSSYYQQPQYSQPPSAYPPGRPYPPPPPYQYRQLRPGTVTAAAVIGFVAAGLLVFAAIVLLTSVSAVNDFDTSDRFRSTTTEFGLDGLLNLIAAAFLVTGGVKLLARKRTGQLLLWIGSGLTVAYAIYWMMRVDAIFGVLFWATLFGSLVIIAACMAGSAVTRQWLETEAVPAPPPPTRPY
jgi:hypothetical protein